MKVVLSNQYSQELSLLTKIRYLKTKYTQVIAYIHLPLDDLWLRLFDPEDLKDCRYNEFRINVQISDNEFIEFNLDILTIKNLRFDIDLIKLVEEGKADSNLRVEEVEGNKDFIRQCIKIDGSIECIQTV